MTGRGEMTRWTFQELLAWEAEQEAEMFSGVATLAEFEARWRELEDEARVDAHGGGQYTRVRDTWLAGGLEAEAGRVREAALLDRAQDLESVANPGDPEWELAQSLRAQAARRALPDGPPVRYNQ